MRIASLCLVTALGTGCISGIDTKPYNITVGPRLSPEEKALIVVAAVALVVVGKFVTWAVDSR
ncbi:MAG: hypothetical protein ACKV2T_39185 [Kofleriaceae bacterium]